MTRITKNELIAINARLSAEVASLRAELSAAKVQQHVERPARPSREHEYSSHGEAINNLKRLVASPLNAVMTFSCVGTKVIARPRAH